MKELMEEYIKGLAKKIREAKPGVGNHYPHTQTPSFWQPIAKGEYCPVCNGCCQSPPGISHVRFVPQKVGCFGNSEIDSSFVDSPSPSEGPDKILDASLALFPPGYFDCLFGDAGTGIITNDRLFPPSVLAEQGQKRD